ncbi:hypothetical protein [Paenibacillus sp. MMS20-IR301]|uniref:hypothetical protein n=1 Tax=Paenibacillus sp. MMS20-IR301 TaxID=2895946 RepID=UPI0028F028D8|nr:hypothetical protein [Paenibacillus sp. MMS20-IR301]WNS42034.1 hypothetical protein LOS79_23920 [Paenibacillus sp. MMS20-IR301]
MYKSVIRDSKFVVLVVDGLFDTTLMELPTEELADKVAYELQSAWDQGVAWGSYYKEKEHNGRGYDKNISETIQKLMTLSPADQEAYNQRLSRRNERVQRIEETRRWRNVLNWKSKQDNGATT